MEEILWIVNEKDEEIGMEARKTIHNSASWHRGIHIFLFDTNNKMIVQKRGKSKDKSPGLLDCAVSGHVPYGSNYARTANEELMEELGIQVPLKKLIKFRMVYGNTDYMISQIYKGIADFSDIKINKKEIDALVLFDIEGLRDNVNRHPGLFTSWFREMLRWYFGMKSDLIVMK